MKTLQEHIEDAEQMVRVSVRIGNPCAFEVVRLAQQTVDGERYHERLRAALRQLVDVEDMRLRLRQLHEMGHGTDYTDYHRLLPMAWAAAREALGPNAELTCAQQRETNDDK